jgi:hypothetical protein
LPIRERTSNWYFVAGFSLNVSSIDFVFDSTSFCCFGPTFSMPSNFVPVSVDSAAHYRPATGPTRPRRRVDVRTRSPDYAL